MQIGALSVPRLLTSWTLHVNGNYWPKLVMVALMRSWRSILLVHYRLTVMSLSADPMHFLVGILVAMYSQCL